MSKKQSKVIVITGASAGVGRSIAQKFAREGAKLALLARGEDKLESTAEEVRRLGGQALAISVDVSEEAALEAAARRIERELGEIDIWINNAMVSVLGPIKDLKSDEIRRVTDVTYLGSVNGILVAARRMIPRDRGHIIQIGSALSYQSIPLQSAYCGAKQAIRGFIQSFRIELLHDKSNVKVSEVHLPAVNTPQFEWMRNHMPEHPQPVSPIYQPEVIARAVSYIARNPRRELWVGGSTVQAILASKLVPRMAERYLAMKAYSGQQSRNQANGQSEDNLFQPVDMDYGSHGKFDHESTSRSYQLWMNMNRLPLAVAGIVAAGAVLFLKGSSRERVPLAAGSV